MDCISESGYVKGEDTKDSPSTRTCHFKNCSERHSTVSMPALVHASDGSTGTCRVAYSCQETFNTQFYLQFCKFQRWGGCVGSALFLQCDVQ